MPQGKEHTPKEVVTYHDPCHLLRHMGVREEPRALLRSLTSSIFREMEGADQCCGMGGSFRLTHPGISRSILNKKTDAIARSGARKVVTSCMGCWLQLREGLHAQGLDVEVSHLAECLWKDAGGG
jgi:glycolate oxidase iron-sulfur subunit